LIAATFLEEDENMVVYDPTSIKTDVDYQKLREDFKENKLSKESEFSKEELEIIACSFKQQLVDIRQVINKINILFTKNTFESKKIYLE
jgi:hypothetical protein